MTKILFIDRRCFISYYFRIIYIILFTIQQKTFVCYLLKLFTFTLIITEYRFGFPLTRAWISADLWIACTEKNRVKENNRLPWILADLWIACTVENRVKESNALLWISVDLWIACTEKNRVKENNRLPWI
jgi:hypothetical protein